MTITEVQLELGWGPAKLKGSWEPNTAERDAAWELYVQLVTRISVAPIRPGEGLLREALTSLYQLFGECRKILVKYGPTVAQPPKRPGQLRFGYLAVWMLNAAIRPVLSYWHPELARWEASQGGLGTSATQEVLWDRQDELRKVLEDLRKVLMQYAETFAIVCEAPALVDATKSIEQALVDQNTPTL